MSRYAIPTRESARAAAPRVLVTARDDRDHQPQLIAARRRTLSVSGETHA